MKKLYKCIIILCMILMAMSSSIVCFAAETGTWKHNSKGWWYENSDGSYIAYQIININGKFYFFNQYGYMATGWQKIPYCYENGNYYNFKYDTDGNMKYSWYYFKSNGSMAKDEYIQGYYVDKHGVCDDSIKYSWKKYTDEDGTSYWRYEANSKKYVNYGWTLIDNKYYYFLYGKLAQNIYVGNNIDGFYWVDKNGTWSYKAKLYQYNATKVEKNKIANYYKDTKGYIPTGKLKFYNGYYGELLVTFDKNGKVTKVQDYYSSKTY